MLAPAQQQLGPADQLWLEVEGRRAAKGRNSQPQRIPVMPGKRDRDVARVTHDVNGRPGQAQIREMAAVEFGCDVMRLQEDFLVGVRADGVLGRGPVATDLTRRGHRHLDATIGNQARRQPRKGRRRLPERIHVERALGTDDPVDNRPQPGVAALRIARQPGDPSHRRRDRGRTVRRQGRSSTAWRRRSRCRRARGWRRTAPRSRSRRSCPC